MRANPRTRIRPAAHTHAHTHIYAHVRTYTRTRRNFSDNESALQHCQTEFNHQSDTIHFYYPTTVQSISILAPHWLRHLYKLPSSVTHLLSIYNHFPTIHQPFNHLSLISHLLSPLPIITNRPSTHHILSLCNNKSNSLSYQYVSIL